MSAPPVTLTIPPHPAPSEPHDHTITGALERITFRNRDTGYLIGGLLQTGHKDLTPILGTLGEVNLGQQLELRGDWTIHPRYGRQFKVTAYRAQAPTTAAALVRYLGSGLIQGLGATMAERIVDHFGGEAIQVIETTPKRLVEVAGIGPKRARAIEAGWKAQEATSAIMLFLAGLDLSPTLASRVYKHYGAQAITVLRENSYILAQSVWGVGFITADRIGRQLGFRIDHPGRLRAGLIHALEEAASSAGHCLLPVEGPKGILDLAATLLAPVGKASIAGDLLAAALTEAIDDGAIADDRLTAERGRLSYLPHLHHAETALATRITVLRAASIQPIPPGRVTANPSYADLNEEQRLAIRTALAEPLSIITGLPGCGKSHSVKAIVQIALAAGKTILLAAPTGKAAQRLSDLTAMDAATIHRLIELQPGGRAARNQAAPLNADILVVDEAGMIDLPLARALIDAVRPGTQVVLVGDPDQLPSVGPGAILRDLLAAGIPHIRLTTLFRTAAGSGIARLATRVNRGDFQPTQFRDLSDAYWFNPACLRTAAGEGQDTAVARLIVDLLRDRIPRKFGIASHQIQVLTPMRRGPAGMTNLNACLQAALVPPDPDRERAQGARVFRSGDRVIATVNNYDKDVFNGATGRVLAVNVEDMELRVAWDDGADPTSYRFNELEELEHAFALTVHRSQGSEYPCAIVVALGSQYMMLKRNLLYTAITRAKQLAVIVAGEQALLQAVGANETAGRQTGLAARLRPDVQKTLAKGAVVPYTRHQPPSP
ncbi:MAG TPA: ATP-dependent RecD-like DNA helicase [Chloroflexota bacterium]|nr:ATP-dependent RecD-like DNA helicase [Chloroflexota bacterium]